MMLSQVFKASQPKEVDYSTGSDFETALNVWKKQFLKIFGCEFQSYSEVIEDSVKNPEIKLNDDHPTPMKKNFIDKDAYKKSLDLYHSKKTRSIKELPKENQFIKTSEYTKALEDNKAIRDSIINSTTYKDQKRAYDAYCDYKKIVGKVLLKAPKKSGSRGVLQSSIATDGVSVSFMFTKKIMVQVNVNKKTKKKLDDSNGKDESLTKVEKYDHNQTTVHDDMVVLGIDPGRTTLVTVVVYDAKNHKKYSWNLSRGKYHADSGIMERNKKHAKRFEHLKEAMSKIGVLNTSKTNDIENYLKNYNVIEKEWWTICLKTTVTRDKLQSYIGKRKVVDKFFSNLYKTVDKLFPGKSKVVAYGATGPSMACTGKGELAVPTTGTFIACKRVFKDHKFVEKKAIVNLTNEDLSTKKCWCCQGTKLPVYKTPSGQLFYSNHRVIVPACDIEAVKEMTKEYQNKNKLRRGGIVINDDAVEEKEKEEEKKLYYPEVRGLRFCPKCRNYFDRDSSAALTIGRLEVMKMVSNSRPITFCQAPKNKLKEALPRGLPEAVESDWQKKQSSPCGLPEKKTGKSETGNGIKVTVVKGDPVRANGTGRKKA
jgi:hypothetical protein